MRAAPRWPPASRGCSITMASGRRFLRSHLRTSELHAARIGQDRHQQRLRKIGRQIGQVQRQAGADHHHVAARLERDPHIGRVVADRTHHVHRDQAHAGGQRTRGMHFARQGFAVGAIDQRAALGLATAARGKALGARHQVGVVPPQVHRADRAHPAQRRHACRPAGVPIRRCPCRLARSAAACDQPGAEMPGRCVRAGLECPARCRSGAVCACLQRRTANHGATRRLAAPRARSVDLVQVRGSAAAAAPLGAMQ